MYIIIVIDNEKSEKWIEIMSHKNYEFDKELPSYVEVFD